MRQHPLRPEQSGACREGARPEQTLDRSRKNSRSGRVGRGALSSMQGGEPVSDRFAYSRVEPIREDNVLLQLWFQECFAFDKKELKPQGVTVTEEDWQPVQATSLSFGSGRQTGR